LTLTEAGQQFLPRAGRVTSDYTEAVESVSGLSGHADRGELLRWLREMPDPRQVFLTHGELESARAFAEMLHERRGWNAVIPKLGQHFEP